MCKIFTQYKFKNLLKKKVNYYSVQNEEAEGI